MEILREDIMMMTGGIAVKNIASDDHERARYLLEDSDDVGNAFYTTQQEEMTIMYLMKARRLMRKKGGPL